MLGCGAQSHWGKMDRSLHTRPGASDHRRINVRRLHCSHSIEQAGDGVPIQAYQLVVRHDLRRMLTCLPHQIGRGRGVVGDMVAKETANVFVLYLFLRHAFQDGRPACVDEVKKNINKKTNKGKHPTKQKPSNLQKQFTEILDGDRPPCHHRRHLSTKNGVSYDLDSSKDEKE